MVTDDSEYDELEEETTEEEFHYPAENILAIGAVAAAFLLTLGVVFFGVNPMYGVPGIVGLVGAAGIAAVVRARSKAEEEE
jgi:hypothetical protein